MVALSPRLVFLMASCLLAMANSMISLEDIQFLRNLTRYAMIQLEPMIAEPQYRPQTQEYLAAPEQKDIETMLSAFSDIQRYFFHMLKKDSECPSFPSPNPHCDSISTNYHDFMAETTRFLALLMELKPIPSSVSVFKDDQGSYLWYNLNILQTKWASRNMGFGPSLPGNTPSFIEQRQSLYKATGCFPNMREVLRRDVEIVELLNDLKDQYWTETFQGSHGAPQPPY